MMTQWYVKELSKLTQVSVQTLHHYDRIGLLEPSLRLANGYRSYSEKDLLKLQQIIALKFFGFTLTQVKVLLSAEVNVIDHFSIQSQLLEEKAKSMAEASLALKTIIAKCGDTKSIPWATIIQLMEIYRMTQQLEKTWAGKVLNQNELKQYANFEHDLKSKFTSDQKKAVELGWNDIVNQVNKNLNNDPTGEIGIDIGKRSLDWVNTVYGRNYALLANAIWEKGFKGGNIGEENNLTPEAVAWLDKAMDTYCRNKIYTVLNKIETHSDKIVSKEWEALLADMYGDEQSLKDDLIRAALSDDKVCEAAKTWLKQGHRNS